MSPEKYNLEAKKQYYKSVGGLFYTLRITVILVLFCIGSVLTLLSLPFELFRHILFSDLLVYSATAILGIYLFVQSIHKQGFLKGYSHAAKNKKEAVTVSEPQEDHIMRTIYPTTPSLTIN